jgi:hypothetical protein
MSGLKFRTYLRGKSKSKSKGKGKGKGNSKGNRRSRFPAGMEKI